MSRISRNELAYQYADGRRWLSSGIDLGDGARAVNTDNNLVTATITASGRAFSTCSFDALANQWYAATIRVTATTGGPFNGTSFQIDNEDFSDQPQARLFNIGVGVWCVRFMRTTDGVINMDFGLGTNTTEVNAGSITMTQPQIEEIADINEVPSIYALPQMKSAHLTDKSGTTVAASGEVTFGDGAVVGGEVDVVLVHSDSFSNEPNANDGEWGFLLNNDSSTAAYVDALGGRELSTGALTVADSLQLTTHLEAVYYTTSGTLVSPLVDTNVILPSILVVDMGVNDVIQGRSLEQMQSAFELEVSNARAVNPDLVIITNNVSPFENNVNWTQPKQDVQDSYNAWLVTRVAQDSNMYLNDIYALLGEVGSPQELATTNPANYDSGDGLHPNQAGADAIAASVLLAISSIATASPTLTTLYGIDGPELYGAQAYWYEDYGNSSSSVTSTDFFIDATEPFAAGDLMHARLSNGWFTLRFTSTSTVEIA